MICNGASRGFFSFEVDSVVSSVETLFTFDGLSASPRMLMVIEYLMAIDVFADNQNALSWSQDLQTSSPTCSSAKSCSPRQTYHCSSCSSYVTVVQA